MGGERRKLTCLNRQPIPVCITRKDLKGELERAVSSTYMHQNQGTCT
jgi:ribosome biogenesis protein UTP30